MLQTIMYAYIFLLLFFKPRIALNLNSVDNVRSRLQIRFCPGAVKRNYLQFLQSKLVVDEFFEIQNITRPKRSTSDDGQSLNINEPIIISRQQLFNREYSDDVPWGISDDLSTGQEEDNKNKVRSDSPTELRTRVSASGKSVSIAESFGDDPDSMEVIEAIDSFRFKISSKDFAEALQRKTASNAEQLSTRGGFDDLTAFESDETGEFLSGNGVAFSSELFERLNASDMVIDEASGRKTIRIELDTDEFDAMITSTTQNKGGEKLWSQSNNNAGTFSYDEDMMNYAEELVASETVPGWSIVDEFNDRYPSTAKGQRSMVQDVNNRNLQLLETGQLTSDKQISSNNSSVNRISRSNKFANWNFADVSKMEIADSLVGTFIIGLSMVISLKLMDQLAIGSYLFLARVKCGINWFVRFGFSTLMKRPLMKKVVSKPVPVPILLIIVIGKYIFDIIWEKNKEEWTRIRMY